MRVVNSGVQDEDNLMGAAVSLAPLKVRSHELLALFGLQETLRIERIHLFGKLDEAVNLA